MSDREQTTSASYRILVVDDEPETARLIRKWFQGQPYDILDARDGETGLRLALSERPDLILLDLRMPGMDGLSVARSLKREASTCNIPVFLLTACNNVDDKVEAFAAGVDDYVTKPFAFEEVDARIRSTLRKRDVYKVNQSTLQALQASNKHLEELLIVDEKTGVHNFRQFQRKLHEEWLRAERYGDPLSLIMFDLDNFKAVNDTLGHPAGDLVLREFAMLVMGGARANDTAARYGGEEFSIILPHTEADMAARVAERTRRAVMEFVFLAGEKPHRLTVSAGVATYPTSAGVNSAAALLHAADRALYRAKRSGKNRVFVADRGPLDSERGS